MFWQKPSPAVVPSPPYSIVQRGFCFISRHLSTFVLYVQDAKAQLQHVLTQDPSSGHAWHTLGQMAEETGNLEEAARCYVEGRHSSGQYINL